AWYSTKRYTTTRSHDSGEKRMDISYRIIRALCRILVFLQMRLHVRNAARVPTTGPVLVVSNHLGSTDPLTIAVDIPRQLRIVAKAELFDWPFIGWLARRGDVIPIRRGESDRDALRTVLDALYADQCALVFPEGGYRQPPEVASMLPVKPGAAWLALKTGATVVPVGIWGTEYVWSRARGWRFWHRPRVHVAFGEPYLPVPPRGVSTKAATTAVAEEMARRIAELLPEDYRGFYGDVRAGVLVGS
ncbi:MAG: lysophospholipid acyltransferase family protein, partial [Ktedonobacterales bacterium]